MADIGGGIADGAGIAEEDRMRADLYGLLGWLLKAPPDAAGLARIAAMRGDDSALGRAIAALAKAARGIAPERVDDEYHVLFVGLGRGELMPYGSYYLTGFLHEKPLAKLRLDMARLGIARAEGNSEPEDNIAALCEMMAGLILGRFGAPADLAGQRQFFDRHIGPWAGRFFADLEEVEAAAFYMPVGRIGGLFMDIEAQAFEMAA